MKRCRWAQSEPNTTFHDEEWGNPVYDDKVLFEFLILEGAQAGLSWITILKRREGYRKAFKGFDPVKVSKMAAKDVQLLMKDDGIIKNKLKIESAITNAKLFLSVQKEFGSFSDYVWGFVNHTPVHRKNSQMPVTTPESDALSRDLKKRGFKFVGSTICYAYMQACGLVNDHEKDCFRYKKIRKGS